MILHAELLVDHLGHPRTSPQLVVVTRLDRPSQEDVLQLLPLVLAELRLWPRMTLGGQSLQTSFLGRALPAIDRGQACPHDLGYLLERFPLQQKIPRDAPTYFQFPSCSLCSHTSSTPLNRRGCIRHAGINRMEHLVGGRHGHHGRRETQHTTADTRRPAG